MLVRLVISRKRRTKIFEDDEYDWASVWRGILDDSRIILIPEKYKESLYLGLTKESKQLWCLVILNCNNGDSFYGGVYNAAV